MEYKITRLDNEKIMSKYFTLGSYSISILHYSLYYWDKREYVFLRTIRAYKDWLATYYGYTKDDQRMYDIWRRWIEDDPDYLIKYSREHYKNFNNLNIYLDKVLKSVNNAKQKRMLSIYNKYWKLLFLAQPIGDININIDKIYLDLLNKDLKDFLLKKGSIKMFSEYLIDLTTPWKMLITMKEELDFLKIVRNIKQARIKDVMKALKKHLGKYGWIPCWYDNAPWDILYLQKRLNQELKAKDINKRIKRLENFPKATKIKAQRIIKKLGIKGKLLKNLAGLREFTYVRTQVDLHTGFVVNRARPIYEKISKLFGINFEQLKFLMPDEIRSGLNNKISIQELLRRIKPRQKFAVQVFYKDKQKIIIGKKACQLINKIKAGIDTQQQTKNKKNINILEGISASISPRIVKGRARVIGRISQLNSMKEGEVLIVPSTSVDYVAAMKKAVAIVTEVGGLTCHAAIVSRELGKPCIVNTISATTMFKTGDMLQVDSKNGIIKKI